MKRFKSLMLLSVLIGSVSLASCQTAAQRQVISIRENAQVAKQRAMDCIQKIEANPAYKVLMPHTSLNFVTNPPTLIQLADNNVPTDEEIEAIIAAHNETALCRTQIIEDYMKITPGVIPIVVQSYHASDIITVDLIHRKISWGEANKKRLALVDELRIKLQDAGKQLARELEASHEAELAQRQQALNALSQWAYQQQVLMQNQQLINAVNRPVTTHCWWNGHSLQCQSY